MRVIALVLVAGLASACEPVKAMKRPDGGGGSDSGGDDSGGGDDVMTCTTWSATNFTPCTSDSLPTMGLTINASASIDTTTGTVAVGSQTVSVPTTLLSQSGGVRQVRLISVSALQIDGAGLLTIRGDYPLLLAVHGDATIQGSISLAATSTVPGPGGDDPFACTTSNGGIGGDSQDSIDGGGGGGGAGYGVAGSAGGSNPNISGGGAGGVASADTTLSPLRGGCTGGRGGPQGSAGGGQNGGKGGGAIQISARGSISVSGSIDAGGGGGLGGTIGGGGGGGSGGAIFLETGTGGVLVSATGRLCANGGSGAEGSGGSIAGNNGVSGSCQENFGANTLDGQATGGVGGTGGHLNNLDGNPGGSPASFTGSGGGGGGAVGKIRIKSNNTQVDPNSTVTPAHAT